jgi:hypothetical protein
MKRRALMAVIGAVSVALGCGSLTSFDTDVTADGVIPGVLMPPGQQFAAYGSVGSALSQTFSSKGVTGFKSAKISAGYVSVPSSDAQYLADITSFTLSVSAPGQPTVEIAHQTGDAFAAKPASGKVDFVIDPVELKPYIEAGSASFTAAPMFAGKPPFNVPIHLDMTVHVQVL